MVLHLLRKGKKVVLLKKGPDRVFVVVSKPIREEHARALREPLPREYLDLLLPDHGLEVNQKWTVSTLGRVIIPLADMGVVHKELPQKPFKAWAKKTGAPLSEAYSPLLPVQQGAPLVEELDRALIHLGEIVELTPSGEVNLLLNFLKEHR